MRIELSGVEIDQVLECISLVRFERVAYFVDKYGAGTPGIRRAIGRSVVIKRMRELSNNIVAQRRRGRIAA